MAAPTPLMPDVTVNGVTIPSALIGAEAQNHPAPDGKPGLAWRAAARALATRELLLQEARAQGLAARPAELAPGQVETAEEALIRALLDSALPPAAPDEAQARAFYDADPDRFRAPALCEAAHILLAAPEGDAQARAAARARALALLDDLRRDPRRFAELAAAHSDCPSGANGGLLGQLSPGDTVPEFEAALAGIDEGAIAGAPVESRYGFHLVRLIARAQGAVLPFAAVLPHLRQAQEKAHWVRASRAFVAGLVAKATITGIDLGEAAAGQRSGAA